MQKIYDTRVARDLFVDARPVDRPVAVVLGGQPGAGKTPMQVQAAREFADKGGLVRIIGDDLRAYLPHYKALQRADAISRRMNVLVEGTMRNPDVVARTQNDFRAAGYRS
ncbi:MAG: zeta toxin family protein [Hyphomicrobiaceae bacterium]